MFCHILPTICANGTQIIFSLIFVESEAEAIGILSQQTEKTYLKLFIFPEFENTITGIWDGSCRDSRCQQNE